MSDLDDKALDEIIERWNASPVNCFDNDIPALVDAVRKAREERDAATRGQMLLIAAAKDEINHLLEQRDEAYEHDEQVCASAAYATDRAIKAEAQIAAVRALHARVEHDDGPYCEWCGGCTSDERPHWPCPTIRALDGDYAYYADRWGDDKRPRDDVKAFVDNLAEVVYYSEGENDGPNWIALFALKAPTEKGQTHVFVDAGCDYTGWDCQAGGAYEYTTLEHKQRLGIVICPGIAVPIRFSA